MRTLLTGCLAIIMTFTMGMEAYTRLFSDPKTADATNLQTYQISMDNEWLSTVYIPPEGDAIVYNHYEGHVGETMMATVLVTLTIDGNGNMVG